MKIRIVENFTGYPDGKTPREFAEGEVPKDLSDEYAELLVKKGHAAPITSNGKPGPSSTSEVPVAQAG